MNKGFVTTRLLLVLGVVVVALGLPQKGLTLSPAVSAVSCSQVLERVRGHENLIDYYVWLRSASDEEQYRQHNCAVSVAKAGTPRGKLMLALTLITPDTPFADFARAKILLGEYLHDSGNEESDDRNLAVLMLAMLDEVARLEEQLDQLKAIEKDITATEQSVNVPTPAPEPSPAVNDELEKEDTTSR